MSEIRHLPSSVETLEPRRLLAAGPLPQVSVEVDLDAPRQTMEGFGAAMISWDHVDLYEDPQFYNDVANDLGASAVRIPVPPSFEEFNDDGDPDHIDWSGFSSRNVAPVLDYVAELEKRQDMTVLATVWSPPFWMKMSHDTSYGSHLDPLMRGEYAEYLAAFVIAAERDFGVDIDVIGLQNEPLFVMPYESTIMTPWQMAETMKVVRAKFDALGLDTKLMIGEDLATADRFEWWVDAAADVLEDPLTGEWDDFIWGTHWGPPGSADEDWSDAIDRTGNPVWFTEAGSKGFPNWQSGVGFLNEALTFINDGGISAYFEWQSVDIGGSPDSSWYYKDPDLGVTRKTARYAATKHLSRWVRPGAVHLETTTAGEFDPAQFGPDVRAAGFYDEARGAHTVVLVNNSWNPAEVTVDLTGGDADAALDGWRLYQSDRGDEFSPQDFASEVDIDGGFATLPIDPDGRTVTFTIPGKGMMTLDDGGPEPFEPRALDSARARGVPPDPRRLGQLSYLHQVAQVGWIEGVRQEMTDARMTARYFDGRDILFTAASAGLGSMRETGRMILAEAARLGMDVNRADDIGMTPLLVAAGSQQFGEWYTDSTGFYSVPPRWAADRLADFVAAGADPFVKDDFGRGALHHSAAAVSFRFTNPPEQYDYVTPQLLAMGLDVNKIDRTGRTALDYALGEHNAAAAGILAAWDQDTAAPEVLDAAGVRSSYLGATFTFDEALASGLTAADFVLVREDGLERPVTIERAELAAGNTAVTVRADLTGGMLPDGHWRVYVVPGGAADLAGNRFAATTDARRRNAPDFAPLAHLNGDGDGDGRVGLGDFNRLASNWNGTAGTITGGDYNLDGWVNLRDFQLLAANFGKSLPAAPTGDFGGRAPAGDPQAGRRARLDDAFPTHPALVAHPGPTATLFGDTPIADDDELP